ncbi:MAG: hypothetical protein QXI93_05430 [Candidatus Methanomethylicia archaeon]
MLFTLGSILYSLHAPSHPITKAALILFEVFIFFVVGIIVDFWSVVGVNGISYTHCSQYVGDTCLDNSTIRVLDKASLEFFFRAVQEILVGVVGWGWLLWNAIMFSIKQLTKVEGG